jgi:hypothetical protein
MPVNTGYDRIATDDYNSGMPLVAFKRAGWRNRGIDKAPWASSGPLQLPGSRDQPLPPGHQPDRPLVGRSGLGQGSPVTVRDHGRFWGFQGSIWTMTPQKTTAQSHCMACRAQGAVCLMTAQRESPASHRPLPERNCDAIRHFYWWRWRNGHPRQPDHAGAAGRNRRVCELLVTQPADAELRRAPRVGVGGPRDHTHRIGDGGHANVPAPPHRHGPRGHDRQCGHARPPRPRHWVVPPPP